MPRVWMLLLSLLLSACLFFVVQSHADEKDQELVKQVQALQQLVHKVIVRGEQSVVGICVSRSEDYGRYGQGPSFDDPCLLGKFRPNLLITRLRNLGVGDGKIKQIVQRLDLANPALIPESFGSGILLDDKGLILTNYHLVRDATKLYVRLHKNMGSYANIHAADPRSDLAVLRLVQSPTSVKPLPLASGESIKRGQFVVALAYPPPNLPSVGTCQATWGIISNIQKRWPNTVVKKTNPDNHYHPLLQTDARIHAGCSGGALLNMRGELIGLTTTVARVAGRGASGTCAVPMSPTRRRVVEILRQGREVEYGFLGVSVVEGNAASPGVAISHVIPGSPADHSGLQPRDIILSVNQVPLENGDDLAFALSKLLSGTTAKLRVKKATTAVPKSVQVVLAKCFIRGKTLAARSERPYFRGLRIDDSSLLVQPPFLYLNVKRIPKGVMVSDVKPNSPAATKLLKPGEVITHVNKAVVRSPREFYKTVAGQKGAVELTILNAQPGQPSAKVTLNEP